MNRLSCWRPYRHLLRAFTTARRNDRKQQVRAAVGLSHQGRGAIERRPVAVAGVLMPIGAAAKQFPARPPSLPTASPAIGSSSRRTTARTSPLNCWASRTSARYARWSPMRRPIRPSRAGHHPGHRAGRPGSSLRQGRMAQREIRDVVGHVVGSHFAWRMTPSLAAGLQDSHRNGGRVFLIFVADPRTVRLCNSGRPLFDTSAGGTVRFLSLRVRGRRHE